MSNPRILTTQPTLVSPLVAAVLPLGAIPEGQIPRASQLCSVHGADAIEWRLDHPDFRGLPEPEQRSLLRIWRAAWQGPIIATCRNESDGGWLPAQFSSRHDDLLHLACDEGADLADIEANRLPLGDQLKPGDGFIVSQHLLASDPHDEHNLTTLLQHASHVGRARYVKLVLPWTSDRDLLLVRELLNSHIHAAARLSVTLAGGGTRVRRWCLALGSALAYASAPEQEVHLPELPALRELTRAPVDPRRHMAPGYAVCGTPIQPSRSPWIHNALTTARGDVRSAGWYGALECEDAKLAKGLAEALGLRGLSTTKPLKRGALDVADRATPLAKHLGAANTLSHVHSSGWEADNTDVSGLVRALQRLLPQRISGTRVIASSMPDMRALVLGAGGAARACVQALRQLEMKVFVWARRPEEATALCELGADVWQETPIDAAHPVNLLINATGVTDKVVGDSLTPWRLSSDAIVMDLAYPHGGSAMLREAEARGYRTLDGSGMLLEQAYEQRRIWGLASVSDGAHALMRMGMKQRLESQPLRLALIGYRCAGKSHMGAKLAERLGVPLYDLDQIIASEQGASAHEIFAQQGEAHWRALEVEALQRVLDKPGPCVLVPGGGIVESARAMRLLHAESTLLWLRVSAGSVLARWDDSRPRLNPDLSLPAEIAQRLEARNPRYAMLADGVIDADGSPADVMESLQSWIGLA